jgi:hypothetical protein
MLTCGASFKVLTPETRFKNDHDRAHPSTIVDGIGKLDPRPAFYGERGGALDSANPM